MSEHDIQDEKREKVYPGGIDRYNEVRAKRLAIQDQDSEFAVQVAILEELVGLNYILDGIRYSVRKP
jgi:hypothetical protein